MNRLVFKYLVSTLMFFASTNAIAQTCGFGCLGLSGVYGGYSIQQYEAKGLNKYLNSNINSVDSKFNFNEGRGFKVGINVVRAEYTHFFFTLKGYYQFLSEEKRIESDDNRGYKNIYDNKLEINNWGIGLDLGIPLFRFIDWKIVEGELKFFSPKLSVHNYNSSSASSYDFRDIYTPNRIKMGFAIGSGLIFHVIEDYISLEVTVLGSFIEIDNLSSDANAEKVPNSSNRMKLISHGGLQGVVQLNVGIPL